MADDEVVRTVLVRGRAERLRLEATRLAAEYARLARLNEVEQDVVDQDVAAVVDAWQKLRR